MSKLDSFAKGLGLGYQMTDRWDAARLRDDLKAAGSINPEESKQYTPEQAKELEARYASGELTPEMDTDQVLKAVAPQGETYKYSLGDAVQYKPFTQDQVNTKRAAAMADVYDKHGFAEQAMSLRNAATAAERSRQMHEWAQADRARADRDKAIVDAYDGMVNNLPKEQVIQYFKAAGANVADVSWKPNGKGDFEVTYVMPDGTTKVAPSAKQLMRTALSPEARIKMDFEAEMEAKRQAFLAKESQNARDAHRFTWLPVYDSKTNKLSFKRFDTYATSIDPPEGKTFTAPVSNDKVLEQYRQLYKDADMSIEALDAEAKDAGLKPGVFWNSDEYNAYQGERQDLASLRRAFARSALVGNIAGRLPPGQFPPDTTSAAKTAPATTEPGLSRATVSGTQPWWSALFTPSGADTVAQMQAEQDAQNPVTLEGINRAYQAGIIDLKRANELSAAYWRDYTNRAQRGQYH